MGSIAGRPTIFRISRILIFVVVAVIWFAACAGSGTSTSGEWGPIPAEEASLVLYAPGLDSPRVSFKRKTKDMKIYELGHWRPASGTAAEARIILFRFSPVAPSGMTFVREPPLEERVRRWFRSETIEMGAAGKHRNVLGSLEYTRFTRDGATQCVFFRQFGDTYSDQRGYFSDGSTGHGDIMIRGYYCVAPFHELSQSTIDGFLSGIGLKGFGVPAKPLDLTLSAAPVALASAAGRRQSTSTGAFPYEVKFTSMVYKASGGQELADDLTEVSLEHGRLYIYVKWRGLTLEKHVAQLRVLDGAGRQVDESRYEFSPTSTYWNNWWPYNIDPDADTPGRWRFEIDLDGETLVEKSLIVTASDYGPSRSGVTRESRDLAFARYQMYDEAFKYKIFVQSEAGAWAWRVRETFYAAQDQANRVCLKRGREVGLQGVCKIYAAGDEVVWDLADKERLEAIRAYSE